MRPRWDVGARSAVLFRCRRRFSVHFTGIETSAMLDPRSGTAFINGFTFASTADFTGTMTPTTTTVVPEPQTYVLLLAGLGSLGGTSGLRSRTRSIGADLNLCLGADESATRRLRRASQAIASNRYLRTSAFEQTDDCLVGQLGRVPLLGDLDLNIHFQSEVKVQQSALEQPPLAGNVSPVTGGERPHPLHCWRTPSSDSKGLGADCRTHARLGVPAYASRGLCQPPTGVTVCTSPGPQVPGW